jgi:hypothetical protein
VQGKSTLSDKIFTEKEKFRLGYAENPSFLRLKTRGSELIQILLPSTLHLMTAMLPLGPIGKLKRKFTEDLILCPSRVKKALLKDIEKLYLIKITFKNIYKYVE